MVLVYVFERISSIFPWIHQVNLIIHSNWFVFLDSFKYIFFHSKLLSLCTLYWFSKKTHKMWEFLCLSTSHQFALLSCLKLHQSCNPLISVNFVHHCVFISMIKPIGFLITPFILLKLNFLRVSLWFTLSFPYLFMNNAPCSESITDQEKENHYQFQSEPQRMDRSSKRSSYVSFNLINVGLRSNHYKAFLNDVIRMV